MHNKFLGSGARMKTAIAFGTFDGVHIAHRSLIEKAISVSKDKGCKSVVYTFDKSIKNNKVTDKI